MPLRPTGSPRIAYALHLDGWAHQIPFLGHLWLGAEARCSQSLRQGERCPCPSPEDRVAAARSHAGWVGLVDAICEQQYWRQANRWPSWFCGKLSARVYSLGWSGRRAIIVARACIFESSHSLKQVLCSRGVGNLFDSDRHRPQLLTAVVGKWKR